ncbi:MAG: serine/threonine protein kinase [Thermoguttaceae bacterium]
MPPSRLGPYRIVRKVGRGGMGTVFMGVDDSSGQTAAIKLLSADMAQQSDFRERFKAEIETLRKLNHPNIVQIFGFGEEEELIFYAMEFVSGSSLEEQLSRGRAFSWREVAQFGIAVARALRHAHDRGVIHRDIKPGNLLLPEEGMLKLSDFGIARLFGSGRLTGAGSVLGTAEFMSPEQAEGRPVDPRSDLYSLGGVLYVLLARRPLYIARSFAEMLDKQRFEKPVPLRQVAADIPAEMEQIIHRLLEKNPDRRFGTATVLERRLETMLETFTVSPPAGAMHVTVEPARAASQAGVDPLPIDPLAQTVAATQVPDNPALPAAPSAPASESPPRTTGHFVPVRPGELDVALPERPAGTWISPHTWALVVGLVALWLLAWYMLQPPTADGLYRRIQRKTEGESVESLEQAEDDIRLFLSRFPHDPRSEGLKDFALRIDISQLKNRLEHPAQTSLSPVERRYLDTLNTARADPEAGIAKFQAMIDLFGTPSDMPGPNWLCVQLAKQRLAEVRQQFEAQSREELKLVEQRIRRADELRKTDPERAKAIYRAVVVLYQNKAWAKTVVQQAQAAMEKGK